MGLILDDLYERHIKGMSTLEAHDFLNSFTDEIDNSEKLLDAVNILKTSAVCNFSYRQFYDKVREYIEEDYLPNTAIAVLVMLTNSPGEEKRDIFKEAASYKYDIPLNQVTDEMVKTTKEFGRLGSGYSIDEPPVKNWDEYFYNICVQIARNSKCLSRRIGALLVKGKRLIAAGYNGPAAGIPRCDKRWDVDERFKAKHDRPEKTEGVCPRKALGFSSGQGLEICPAVHAEENAILMCAKEGIVAKDATMYMTCGVPCMNCTNKIIQVGVKEIVLTSLDVYDDTSLYLFENSKVKVRLYDFI